MSFGLNERYEQYILQLKFKLRNKKFNAFENSNDESILFYYHMFYEKIAFKNKRFMGKVALIFLQVFLMLS